MRNAPGPDRVVKRQKAPRFTFVVVPLLAALALTISIAFADSKPERMMLPIEVLGEDGTTVTRTVELPAAQAESVRSLWLQIHGVHYAEQASVRINASPWTPLNNQTATVAEPGKSYGGIGGGFSTLAITVTLPAGSVTEGTNTIRFRFNQTDGVSSGFRVLAWNFVTGDGKKILPPELFVQDAPETWTPILPDADSIRSGQELWRSASLLANSRPNSPRIQAHCADCHAHDGRDLKYFSFSNNSIASRSRFHGLSELQGEQIASYIRSLPGPNPGRPWNPPYQPGPGLEEQPAANWAAGAGLGWVLDKDSDALPFLIGKRDAKSQTALAPAGNSPEAREIAAKITPDIFRPDGNLNAREIPIALQLPDWSGWLPRVHPKDAFGVAFTESEFAALYDGQASTNGKSKAGTKAPLRALLVSPAGKQSGTAVVAAFSQWSQARQAFFKTVLKPDTKWTPELTNNAYSAQLWQLVKTWEMTREFDLESRGRDFFGPIADSRTWNNTIPIDTAPSALHIPNGSAGVGGSALTNEYFNASWYEMQILLNSGNHQHKDRGPVDWVYVVGRFNDLYAQTHQEEPVRLLVAVTKALQSTDPRVGPDDLRRGWRPEDNIDPRILIDPLWAPMFKPLPKEVHRALTTAMLAAWMDKNLQYPVARYLPFGLTRKPYNAPGGYGDITGGQAWKAAQQFKDAGVPPDVVTRLREWGLSYNERAARLQYDQSSRKM